MSDHTPEPSRGRPARPALSLQECERFLKVLWQPDDVREARVLAPGAEVTSGYFDSPGKLAREAVAWDGKANIYVTLNPVKPELLARANNHMVTRPAKTTADTDILARSLLFFDIDSVRPAGTSATDEELAQAASVLGHLTQTLKTEGWPEPLTSLSGNGYNALYGIELPNSTESRDIIQRVLAVLNERFSTGGAHLDTNVANAARLVGLIGTVKIKGEPTEERPHRRSELLSVPREMAPVPLPLLERLAAGVSPARRVRTSSGRRDKTRLSTLLDEAGVDCREQPPDAQRIVWYQIRECPFHGPDHPYECGVGQGPDGHYAGKCFHDQTKGWQEWKKALGLKTTPTPSPNRAPDSPEPAEGAGVFARTDAGNAEFFADLFRDELRYDHRRQSWLTWDAHHWEYDKDGAAYRHAIDAARARYHQAARIVDLGKRHGEASFAIKTENRSRLEAMLRAASCLPPLACTGEHWDADPWLLGVRNGVIDLRRGALHPGRQDENITLITGTTYEPEASCPRWLQFLDEVFVGDQELVDYVQRAVGYSLGGITIEQCLFMLYGTGANGKSLFLSVLRTLLGSYAYNAPFSTFELTRRSDITNDIAALAGKRLVTSSETNEGTRLNEARAKAITGCDPLTARFLYGENFTFRPVAKFFLAVNHLPVVTDDSHGFWRRVRLIPFTRRFTSDADPRLEEKLNEELPGILGWAVRGCLSWQERGLEPPTTVRAATADYQEKSDLLAEFLTDCLVSGETRSIGAAEAYGAYQTWARAQGMTEREMLTATAFGIKMCERFPGRKSKQGKRYLGVGLPGEPVQEVMT